jgi:Skp family chaperone for outer membrane proteins
MGRRHLVGALLAVLSMAGAFLPLEAALGQTQKGNAPPESSFPVAVLRLDKIFRDNPRLQERLVPLKAEAAELDRTVQLRQAEIENIQARLARTPAGSAEFEKLQLQLAKLRTELQLFVNRERQKLQTREGRALLDVYRQVEEVLAAYCKERGIRLVLRHQDIPEGDEPNLQTVMNALNRGVLYSEGIDITDDILQRLARREADKDR